LRICGFEAYPRITTFEKEHDLYTWQITVTRRHGADSAWAESNSAKRCLMTRGALGDEVPM
jgi:hypothetical protein